MAKKVRKPDEPYHIIDRDGCDINWFNIKAVAKKQAYMLDKHVALHAPYRVYKLVTLEEVAVIRAAQRWYDANGEAECHQADVALEYAVEASRVQGK